MASEDKFLDGFKRFKKQYFGNDSQLYDSMKNSQPAKTLMIACCDSRVDPAILTDCDPGDLFTVRNVANLVPPCEDGGHYHGTSAALEYAVNHLEVENIIVMGHANCGGIKALWNPEENISRSDNPSFIDSWVSIAQPAKARVKRTFSERSPQDQLTLCEQQSVLVSLDNLLSFSCIQERVEQGELSLHGWYFDMPTGELLSYNSTTKEFEVVN